MFDQNRITLSNAIFSNIENYLKITPETRKAVLSALEKDLKNKYKILLKPGFLILARYWLLIEHHFVGNVRDYNYKSGLSGVRCLFFGT